MAQGLSRGSETIVTVSRHLRRVRASSVRSIGRLGALALLCLMLSSGAMAQSEQDIRCMQLQQELAAAQGGGAGGADLARLQQDIAEQDRIYQGTQAAMDDAGCYERMFIFGRSLKRTPKCLNMNARVEDARRQLARLQQQQKSLQRGGGNKRRQAELQQALRRSGCSGAPRAGVSDSDLSQRESEWPLSDGLRTPVRRLLLSDPLFDLRQHGREGCRGVPTELRRAGRALRLP